MRTALVLLNSGQLRWVPPAVLVALAAHAAPGDAQTLIADFTFANAGNLGLDSSGYGNNATNLSNVSQGTGSAAGTSSAVLNQSSVFEILTGLSGYTGVPGFTFSAWVEVSGGYTG